MSMKNKISKYMIVAACLLGTACEKKLELINPQALDAEIVYSTDDRIKKVLIGSYAQLGAEALFGGDALWMSELLGSDGELTWVGTFPDPRQIILKNIQVNNANVFATYAAAYRVIYYSNNILANLETVKAVDRTRVEGEAKFLRAMSYFELIKMFGEKPYVSGNTSTLKGVPMPLTPSESSPETKLSRSSVEQVYTQIIADFIDAEAKLQLPVARNTVYANRAGAALGLARVYLQQAKYAEAREAANRCISYAPGLGLSLVPVFANAFNNTENTSEDIFSMQVTQQVGVNSMHTYFSTGNYGARDGDIEVNQKHMDKYEMGDRRKDLFFFEGGAFRVGKWQQNYRNVKVMRLAEAYLTRAECNARLGTSVGATPAADIKLIRDRAALPEIAAPTLAQILKERELELAFEGQAAWDAKRLKLTTDGLAWDDNKMTFPMPLREMNINSELGQNPGYN